MSQATRLRDLIFGKTVLRDAALPPATGASVDLFTIDGGTVVLTGFLGRVTVAIPNEVLSFAISLDPDDGGADVVLASATSVQNLGVGTYLRFNTAAGSALVAATGRAYGFNLAVPIALDPGDLKLSVTGGGAIGTTARVNWVASYAVIDPDARLVAV
jgi:hypothetical protein